MWSISVNIFSFTWALAAFSPEEKAVQWLTFEQVSESLHRHLKKVFIDFMPIGGWDVILILRL